MDRVCEKLRSVFEGTRTSRAMVDGVEYVRVAGTWMPVDGLGLMLIRSALPMMVLSGVDLDEMHGLVAGWG